MRTGKTWNPDDLDFDEEGRLHIKNPQLAATFLSVLGDQGEVEFVILNPQPVPEPPPQPDTMCRCVMTRRVESVE